MTRFYDPDYDYSADEVDDLRREAAAHRRFNNRLSRHPDPRDPDSPLADWEGDDSDSSSDDASDPASLNTEWDADAC